MKNKAFTLIRTIRKNLIIVQQGFTLIELLIVISIIGILAALITFSFTTSQRQARDAQRKSDLSQYRTAIETFANQYGGLFPASASQISTSTLCSSSYLDTGDNCPKDPSEPDSSYHYCTDGSAEGGGASATSYALWASLESDSTIRWIVCSDGRSSKSTTTPSCGGNFNCNITLPTE